MKINVIQNHDGTVLVEFHGQLDMYNAMTVRDKMEQILETAGKLNIDMAGVDYADSSGIGIITYMLSRAKRQKTSLVFSGIQGQLRNILSLNHILDLLDISAQQERL